MRKIDIDVQELDDCIREISKIKFNYSKKPIPTCIGEGRSVEQIELLANTYEALYTSIINLTNNTEEYLRNLTGTFREADTRAMIK